MALVTRRELRTTIVALDREIGEMRETIAAAKPPEDGDEEKKDEKKKVPATYEDVDDIPRLQRLLRAREMTQKALEKKVGWAALEQAGASG